MHGTGTVHETERDESRDKGARVRVHGVRVHGVKANGTEVSEGKANEANVYEMERV